MIKINGGERSSAWAPGDSEPERTYDGLYDDNYYGSYQANCFHTAGSEYTTGSRIELLLAETALVDHVTFLNRRDVNC